MIQPLRTFHRWSFLVLTILLPLILIAGIAVRPASSKPRTVNKLIAIRGADWEKHFFVVQISTSTDGQSSLTLVPTKPILAPDLLVYYSDDLPQQGVLPHSAHLLGRWDPESTYPLPASLNGFVLLYSAAQKTLEDSVSVEGRP